MRDWWIGLNRKLPHRIRELIIGDIILEGFVVAASGNDVDRQPHHALCCRVRCSSASDSTVAAAAAGGTIGPSTKMPRPRKATAINPASTPAVLRIVSKVAPVNDLRAFELFKLFRRFARVFTKIGADRRNGPCKFHAILWDSTLCGVPNRCSD